MGYLPKIKKKFGAVVQLGLGRQIVNLEVAGSNPVGPAIFSYVRLTPLAEL